MIVVFLVYSYDVVYHAFHYISLAYIGDQFPVL